MPRGVTLKTRLFEPGRADAVGDNEVPHLKPRDFSVLLRLFYLF
jgi:hypothetical protein